MQKIINSQLKAEYFDKTLWPLVGIAQAEEEELLLLSNARTTGKDHYHCSDRAHDILMDAFRRFDNLLSKKGYEFELVELVGHEGLFARSKATGKITHRIHTDDKIP